MIVDPPWQTDPCPEAWVSLPIAARQYFRKHPTYLRALAGRGELPGAALYHGKWFVRLPEDSTLVQRILAQNSANGD